MTKIDSRSYITGVGNDLKIAIDDIVGVMLSIHDDIEKLKVKTSKPSKATAKALLEYIAMEDCNAKENLEILCGKEIEQYLQWLESYCEKNGTTQEQALNKIINGEI